MFVSCTTSNSRNEWNAIAHEPDLTIAYHQTTIANYAKTKQGDHRANSFQFAVQSECAYSDLSCPLMLSVQTIP